MTVLVYDSWDQKHGNVTRIAFGGAVTKQRADELGALEYPPHDSTLIVRPVADHAAFRVQHKLN